MTRLSTRLERLPAYAVGNLAGIKQRLLSEGVDVIDLSAGDADFPPPAVAVDALSRAARDPAMSRYAFQVGLRAFRDAAAGYMRRRFGVTFDPQTEILPLLGSKEGLSHLALAVLDPGERCILPDPGYPAYIGGAMLAGAEVEYVPLRQADGFLVYLDRLPEQVLAGVRLVYLNYPNNPTTAVAPRDYLERVVALCRERDIVLAYDNPYVELTFGESRAPSIFEIDGAREIAVEFHSLSKSFSMTGWRIAWAAGNPELIAGLARIKNYVDTGPFLAVQAAAAATLDRAEELVAPVVARLRERRDAAIGALRGIGLEAPVPEATMYVWVPVPGGAGAAAFASRVLQTQGVLLLPGTAFGAGGEGYVRIALTVGVDRLRQAVERIGRVTALVG
jgi:LL-diaminopimelate aminotransferase